PSPLPLNFSARASFGINIFAPKLDGARFRRAHVEQFQIMQWGKSMTINNRVAAFAAFFGLAFTSAAAFADDHPFTEGQVVQVSSIRTAYGKFDDYMKFLGTTWKATQEAAKKAGYITGYKVVSVEARGENDPDIY